MKQEKLDGFPNNKYLSKSYYNQNFNLQTSDDVASSASNYYSFASKHLFLPIILKAFLFYLTLYLWKLIEEYTWIVLLIFINLAFLLIAVLWKKFYMTIYALSWVVSCLEFSLSQICFKLGKTFNLRKIS